MKKLLLWIIGTITIIVLVSLLIPTTIAPSKDTRIILDYTNGTYIAPPCYEQTDITNNNIGEADLGTAEEINFPAHDACTESELEEEKKSLLVAFLEKIELIHTKWDKW